MQKEQHDWNNGVCYTCGATCYHNGATHANGGICTICGEQYENHSKGTTVKYKDKTSTTHTPYYECSFTGCSYTYDEASEPHNVTRWTDNGNGKHSGTCTKCNENVTEDHSYGSDNKCTKCGSVQDCEHNWTTDNDATNHWEKCTKCDEIKNKEKHIVTTWTDNGGETHSGTCTKCGYSVSENHNYGTDGKCKSCGATKATTGCEHNWTSKNDATNHWEACTKCGEIKNKEKHIVTTWTNNGGETHSGACTTCGYRVTENHNYEGNNCKDCGATKPQEECTHDWKQKNDTTNHWEECTKCGKIRNKETHTMSAARDNGDNTHTKTCTKCNYKVTSNHSYNSSNKCTDCGATKATTGCEHNWTSKNDATNHWEACTKCGEIRNKEKHSVTNWKDNGNGTHSGTCGKCNKTLTENHSEGTDGKCTECKATVSNNNNNNNNTSEGKVIPNTGKGTTITIGITAIVALLGIAAVGLKKYHEI